MGFTLAVFPGMSMDDPINDIPIFDEFIRNNFPFMTRTPKVVGSVGSDLIFAVDNDDVSKFAVPRLSFGIRWFTDVVDQDPAAYTPAEVTRIMLSVASL